MCTVIFDPYFRAATAVCVGLCLGNSLTGINAINSFSTRLLTDINNDNPDHSIKPALGNAMVGAIQWLGCLVAPFVSGINVRKVLISGFLVMGAFEIALGIFNVYHKDTLVLGCLLGALFTYQISLGTYTWTYIAEVGTEKAQALGSVFLWGCIQSLFVNYMFDFFGDAGTFWLYGGLSFLIGFLMLIFMRET